MDGFRIKPESIGCPKCRGLLVYIKKPFVTPLTKEVIEEGRIIACNHKVEPIERS